jgi:D-alanyl-D-alanine carboxypeptidase (penicillin-binding protein 5/6)
LSRARKTRVCAAAAAFLLAACLFAPFSANAAGYSEDYGGTAAVFGKSDGTAVLFTGNENTRTDPGSLAEIMTLLLAARALTGERVTRTEYTTVTESAVAAAPGKSTEKAGLKAGEKIKVYDLMYILAVSGANDAAYALAEALEGSVEGFIGLMNDTAQSLGATNTVFTAPCETADGSAVSTARDMYLILSAASADGNFAALAGTREYSVKRTNLSPQRDFTSKLPFRNIRSDYYIEGTVFGFTSTADEHAYKAAVLVKRKGFSAIAVILGDKESEGKPQNFSVFDGVRALSDWHFLNYEVVTVLTSAQIVGTPPVKFGSGKKTISVYAREDIEYLLPAGIQLSDVTVSVIYDFPAGEETFAAPLSNGQTVGKILFIYEGELLGQTDAVIRESVAIDSLALFLTELRFWVVRSETLYLAALIAATLILYAACSVRYLMKKHRIVVFRTSAAKKIPPHKLPPDLAELMADTAPAQEPQREYRPEYAEQKTESKPEAAAELESALAAAEAVDAASETTEAVVTEDTEEFAPGWTELALPGIEPEPEEPQEKENSQRLRKLAASAKTAASLSLQKAGAAAKTAGRAARKAGFAVSRAVKRTGVLIKHAAESAADGLRFAAGKARDAARGIWNRKK